MAKPSLPAQELAQLKDIHLPNPIGWWPLAPGWFILIALVLLFSGISVFFWIRARRNGRGKRKALKILAQYQREYPKPINATRSCARISELLKRVALIYFPRTEIAQLQSQAWVDFLNQSGRGLDFNAVASLLTELPYKPVAKSAQTVSDQDVLQLFSLAKSWIQQRRGRCLN